jgi:sulfur carrier protein
MNITLNNRKETFKQSSLSISELLKLKNFTFKLLVIKVNNKLIKKELYEETIIKDGDNVAVIHLVSGG